MKKLLLGLFVMTAVLGMNAKAAVPGTSNSVFNINGVGSTAAPAPFGTFPIGGLGATNMYTICAGYLSTSTAGDYYGFYGGNALQSTSAGSVFKVSGGNFFGIMAHIYSSGGTTFFHPVIHTAPLTGGDNGSAVPAGAVSLFGDGQANQGSTPFFVNAAGEEKNVPIVGFNIPSGYYASIVPNNGTSNFSICVTGIVQ